MSDQTAKAEPKFYLKLMIDGVDYLLFPIGQVDPPVKRAWRLFKEKGSIYTCHRDSHGLHCTCPDGTYRRENAPEPCKHCRGLAHFGLL